MPSTSSPNYAASTPTASKPSSNLLLSYTPLKPERNQRQEELASTYILCITTSGSQRYRSVGGEAHSSTRLPGATGHIRMHMREAATTLPKRMHTPDI
ncbi:hypothetical protein VTH06DRAFT_6575 [Thermothelomyces fergusii]